MPPRPNKSRPGCWTCKRRHRKCDESLPSCRKCALHGEECEGYGVQRLAFRDCTVVSSSRRNRNQHQRQSQPQQRQHLSLAVPPSSLLAADLMVSSPNDMPILKEFMESVAQTLAISESHNLWREDIAPLISSGIEQQHLRHSIIAVTLMHRTHLEHRVTSDAARHYDCALRDIRQALSAIEDGRNPRQLDSILASLFLLMWFEILARDWHKWNVHLATLTHLISSLDPARAFDSRFQRRLILAVARLEVPNMVWTLHPPLLSPQLYDQMLFSNQPYPEDDMEDAALLAFHRLHVIMARFAIPYADWLRGGLITSEVRGYMTDVLEELEEWHCNLPLPLQRLGDPSSPTTHPRSPLQSTLFIHYLSTKLFVMHVLNPNCTVPGDSAYQFCREVSLDICRLTADLGPPEKRSTVSFRGDVGVILPLSVVSMFLQEEAERAWIRRWVRRVDQEGMWCGRRRSMIIGAWARCAQEHGMTRPFHTMVGQDNIHWKPGQGLNVSIMTYNAAQDWRSSVEVYMNDEDPPEVPI